MSSATDEIKSRLDIIDVLSEYLQLKQSGTNWKANCPFHNEKTPSFMVSRDKQIWHCFGCSEGGDIFGFVMKIEGLEFPEALRLLAKKAGVEIERQDPALASQKNRLMDICSLAAKFYHQTLLKSPEGEVARKYLKDRGLKEETIEDFLLGYAPAVEQKGWDYLSKFLESKGFKENEIFLAGLSVKKEKGVGFYDRFRGRITFPLFDAHGAVVGFTSRVLPQFDDGRMGKYVNTPQTMIYNKSQLLYCLDKAKQEIKKKDQAIIVEGNMDAITSHEAGVKNVVASSGTAMTLEQVRLLKRYTNNLAIAFDTDPAGDKASERGIDTALSEGLNIKVIVVPQGKDPDECIRKNPADWLLAIKNAKSIMEYYFDKTLASADLKKVEDKKRVAQILLRAIQKLSDGVEQTHWLQKLSGLLGVSEQILRETMQKQKRTTVGPVEAKAKETKINTAESKEGGLGRTLLALIIKNPKFIQQTVAHFDPENLPDEKLRSLYKQLAIYCTECGEGQFDINEFKKRVGQEDQILAEIIDILFMLADKEFPDFPEDDIIKEIEKTTRILRKYHLSREVRKIEQAIREAEKEQDKKTIEELLKEFSRLTNELVKLNN